jgi:hypothetical protein
MSLGHYLWHNSDGTTVDINVDALPVTDKPSNILKPNLVIGTPENIGLAIGDKPLELHEIATLWPVPNFYIDHATKKLYHSTTPPTREFLEAHTVPMRQSVIRAHTEDS